MKLFTVPAVFLAAAVAKLCFCNELVNSTEQPKVSAVPVIEDSGCSQNAGAGAGAERGDELPRAVPVTVACMAPVIAISISSNDTQAVVSQPVSVTEQGVNNLGESSPYGDDVPEPRQNEGESRCCSCCNEDCESACCCLLSCLALVADAHHHGHHHHHHSRYGHRHHHHHGRHHRHHRHHHQSDSEDLASCAVCLCATCSFCVTEIILPIAELFR